VFLVCFLGIDLWYSYASNCKSGPLQRVGVRVAPKIGRRVGRTVLVMLLGRKLGLGGWPPEALLRLLLLLLFL